MDAGGVAVCPDRRGVGDDGSKRALARVQGAPVSSKGIAGASQPTKLMKCNEIHYWLLTAKAGALPARVTRHLRDCALCRRRQAQLQWLDSQVAGLPVPAVNPNGKAELLQRLAGIGQE